MAAIIRPTLLLKADLDKKAYSDEVKAEIARSYSYVAPVQVTSHEDESGNVMRFTARINKPYWRSSDEGADEVWESSMVKWLSNMFYKVSATMVAYNVAREEKGEAVLIFSQVAIELGDNTLFIKLDSDSSIPEKALEMVQKARAAVNSTLSDEKDITNIFVTCADDSALWSVEYADGSKRMFDSLKKEFV